MKRKRIFMLLAWFTLIGFSAIGLALIIFFQEQSLSALFLEPMHWGLQLLIGTVVGYISAILALKVIHLPWLQETNQFYTNLVQQFELSTTKIIFISLCAGVGEEILFRGAIQHWLGVVITAIIFVAIHGYINPADWRISIYGIFMTLVMILIGYMTVHLGLISSIAAHFMIDLVLLFKLSADKPPVISTEPPAQSPNGINETETPK
ncbi:MAG: CPBP family intramembrane metalloprotease [Bacteroidia bacterium]|nr:CPBP family intramembrane metalloprotease [Bacteroidia bacterium]